ncbi:hypothetical protein [Micromonospora sp. CA-111912]|uniref:hypothetical protein n=1 Tax=Micromonospora sp. CA-111912 TaxID=3239955 RepID=UPI003D8DDF62
MITLWALGPVFELPVTAMAVTTFPEVAADATFGSSGTQAVLAVAFVTALLAAVVSWPARQTSRALRRAVAVTCWVAAGLLAALMLGFFVGAGWVVFGVLLAHCAAALGALGLLAVRSAVNLPAE